MAKKIYSYESDDIEVTYDVKRCIHAEECVHGSPSVFDPNRRPWIAPENAPAQEIVDTILKCPTGALYFKRKDGGQIEETPARNSIRIAANGPVYVHGDVTIATIEGEEVDTETRLALCRCGESANKPFCDNSHKEAGFTANGDVIDNTADTDITPSGPLKMTPAPNGPVLLNGDFEILSEDGSSIFRGSKTALCRCGASSNKPFCDGTHAAIGFSAD